METCSVVLSFKSFNEILWCDNSNETSLAASLHGTICSSIFYKMKFGIFFGILIFDTLGSERANQTVVMFIFGKSCLIMTLRN